MKVLVGHDGSTAANDAATVAASVAARFQAGLHLVRVVHGHLLADLPGWTAADLRAKAVNAARVELERAAASLRPGGVQVFTAVLEGDPGRTLADLANEDESIGLVVAGSSAKTPLDRARLGSATYELVHLCRKPMWISRSSPGWSTHGAVLRRVLIPVDFSEPSRRALAYGLELAARLDATAELLNVWEPPYSIAPDVMLALPGWSAVTLEQMGHQRARAELDELIDAAGLKERALATRIETGNPAQSILRVAHDGFDLIVMGTHGRGPLGRLALGSVAHKVLANATGPVVLVPGRSAS
jgi:nucleotide-binding universal stress UspA family protein